MQCTKLLANRMHGGSFWLDKEYPIHVDDIHHLIGLSAGKNEITITFHAGTKIAKKHGEDNYYAKYGTERGGRGERLTS